MPANPVSGNEFPVGLRYGAAISLQTQSTVAVPAGNSATVPYSGLPFVGANAFNLTIPDPRTIVHPGDDRVMATDFLPTLDSVTATIEVSRYDMTLNALLTGVKVSTELDITMMPWATDAQGDEPTVGLFFYQQSLNAATKVRNWHSYIMPACRCIPKPAGMSASQTNVTYNVVVNPVAAQLWGTALTDGTNGAIEQGVVEMHSEGQPWIAAWIGAAAGATKYPFATNKQAKSIVKINCWHITTAGVVTNVTASGATFETSGPTITANIPASSIIVALYELA